MRLSKFQLSIIALILANVIWGAALPIYKWTMEAVPPLTFAFLRFFIATLFLIPFVFNKLKFEKKDVAKLVFGAIIAIPLQIPLLFYGLKFVPSINAPIIISSGPILLIVSSMIFLKEKVSAKLLIGTLVSLVGVLIIILKPALVSGFSFGVLGNFLIFLATICSVIQALIWKKIMTRNEVLSTLFLTFLLGSLMLLPTVFLELNSVGLFNLNLNAIVGILYASILSSVVGYYLLIFGLKYVEAAEIGVFSYVDPIATILVAVPLLGETVNTAYVISIILVFGGIFIAEGRLHYHPLHLLGRGS